MRSWYDVQVQDKRNSADIYLYNEIGLFGIEADAFVKDVAGIKSSTINLFVNSPGGDAFGGMAIYNALKRHPATVVATVDGIAASAASFIVQAASKITMAEGSTMMIHEPFAGKAGSAEDHAKLAATLDKLGDNIASIYANRAGGDEAEWRERMKAESWYRAQEAVDVGLADEVLGDVKVAALTGQVFNLSNFAHVPEWANAAAPQEAVPEVDLSVLKKSAIRESPTPDLAALLERYSLRKAVEAGKSSGGGR